jgi:glutamate racemase
VTAPSDPRPIGVFDSGVGGLTVFQALEAALPAERLVYLGDTARVPYGTKSPDTVVRYALEATRFLRRHDVKMLVVACNTASSVAMQAVAEEAGVPVAGVIEPGARRAAEITRSKKIGVIGTRATVFSGAYTRAIHDADPDCVVVSRPCPLFVPLAEEGWTENEVAHAIARTYLQPFLDDDVDTLVLGCTHYPILKKVIGEEMGEGVRLVDSAESVAAEIRARLESEPALASHTDATPGHLFYVTDVPGPFNDVAERFLGRPLGHLERAVL